MGLGGGGGEGCTSTRPPLLTTCLLGAHRAINSKLYMCMKGNYSILMLSLEQK